MLAIMPLVKTGITWALMTFMIGLLLRSARKSWNPLDWCTVDRCLLLMVIFFFFGGFTQSVPAIQLIPGFEKGLVVRFPYINQGFLSYFEQINSIIMIGWGILLLIAIRLRRRSPDNLFFAHVVVQTTAVQTALYCYFIGPVTDPVPMLYGMALGAFNLLLFQPAIAVPWVGTYILFTNGLMFASWFDVIPYAPLYATPPFVNGKIDLFFWCTTLGLSNLIFFIMLFLILFIVARWRDRETKVTEMTALLKKMFGRYLSTDVMKTILDDPSTLELGGERRSVTIMMTDLRGFTALSERLEPERVVQILNVYFEVMMEVVLRYNGTINEIIGDALLIIFGAPQQMPDRAQKAIACAIEMQNAMAEVNAQNRAQGLPELQMGIGLNETEVIVGNVGSDKRSKYAVVGSGVNMTSRIESYTVGGQILISESMFREAGEFLRIDGRQEVLPKGAETPIRIYEVAGIGGQYNMALANDDDSMVIPLIKIPVSYRAIGGKHVEKKSHEAFLVALSKKSVQLDSKHPIELLSNLKMNLADIEEQLSVKSLYGKVIEQSGEKGLSHTVRLTAVPPEIVAYFHAVRQHVEKRMRL